MILSLEKLKFILSIQYLQLNSSCKIVMEVQRLYLRRFPAKPMVRQNKKFLWTKPDKQAWWAMPFLNL